MEQHSDTAHLDDLSSASYRQAWDRAQELSDPAQHDEALLAVVGQLQANVLTCHPDLVDGYWATVREQLGPRFAAIKDVHRRLFVDYPPAPRPPRRPRTAAREPIELGDYLQDDGAIRTDLFPHLENMPEYQDYFQIFLLLGERRTKLATLAKRLADDTEGGGDAGPDAAAVEETYEDYEDRHRRLVGDITELAATLADHLKEQQEALPEAVFTELTDVWRVLDEFAVEQTGFRLPE